ncbi:MAG: outer membrane protein assembly factor BamD [Cytophagaceae bacterium]
MRKIIVAGFFLIGLALFGCSEFQKVQKSDDIDRKLAAAMKYYDKKDYYKANVLFDEIMPLLKGRPEAEKAQYYYAYTFYNDKQYQMSAYYFRDLVETYPRSEYAEESMFMHVKSLYKDSPNFKLDQSNTEDALFAIESFVKRFPKSKYIAEINKITDELNSKVEYKTYESAKLYHKLRIYKSAVVAFNEFLEKYPSSVYCEEIAFLRLESQYELAKHSIVGPKQKERYNEAIDFYHSFIDTYPSSKFKNEAEEIFSEVTEKLAKIQS